MPQKDAVESVRRGNKLLAVLGVDDMVDQLVDRLILDANEVHAALAVRSLAAPIIALFVAGRFRLGEVADDHVVIEIVQPARVLRRIDQADIAVDAKPVEIAQIGLDDALEKRRYDQKLDGHGLAGLHVRELAVLHLPARLAQQRHGLAQIVAHLGLIVVGRILVDLCEHFVRNLAAHSLQDLEFASFGQSLWRCKLRVLEVAVDPLVLTVEQVLVRPLEVECQIERLTHTPVLEFRAAEIWHESLHRHAAF